MDIKWMHWEPEISLYEKAMSWKADISYSQTRKTIRRLSRTLACQIGRIPPRLAQKRRGERGHQRPRHGQPDRQAYTSQPSA